MARKYGVMQQMIRIHANSDAGARPECAPSARDRLADCLTRWKALNLPVTTLCARAGVPYNTAMRWARGDMEPGADRLEAELAKLEAAIAAEKARLRRLLEDAA